MEKTVVVVAANSLSSAACGQNITFDLTLGKTKAPASSAASKSIIKNLWSCAVEAVCEYCRIVFDLFPDQNQVCVAAVDEAKCQPINSWRDEDQEIGKVRVSTILCVAGVVRNTHCPNFFYTLFPSSFFLSFFLSF